MTDMTRPGDVTSGEADRTGLTRSEERLRVGTETVPIERVRLERVVVTEERTVTVEVSREEIRLSREPITGSEGALGARAGDRAPIVVVLHEEQVVVTKTVVPVERVTLHVDVVTDERQISESLRREQIEYLPPTGP